MIDWSRSDTNFAVLPYQFSSFKIELKIFSSCLHSVACNGATQFSQTWFDEI